MQILTTWFVIVLFGLLFAGVMSIALDAQERQDCAELQKQAQTIQPWNGETGFFISKAQKDECDSVHMTVNAAVL